MSDRVGWTVVCRCGKWQFMEVEEADSDPHCSECGNHLMRLKREHAAAPGISEAMLPENGIDVYVTRKGRRLPVHVSRDSLFTALTAALKARKEGE